MVDPPLNCKINEQSVDYNIVITMSPMAEWECLISKFYFLLKNLLSEVLIINSFICRLHQVAHTAVSYQVLMGEQSCLFNFLIND